ncbi:hypothetical protein [Corynebacterium sp. Marseille-P3884]|uniref:hypothetical protein n=1 Tax=Corynebacterium sp. Marseille-P3884 TaxID=2495409 RepID=UPI001B32B6FF|nr:hypothetical protein [Corynebacterium sp. Marseille-P3884]MBP3948400.1 hypothetical protein [Corynebacterium sp. Marseille-P3884]
MNLRNIRLASKVAGTLFNRYRELNNEQKRDVYEAVRIMARGGEGEGTNAEEEDTSNYSDARLQAGDITRAAHARLDRRRALFEADQLDKKEKKELEKTLKKQKKSAKKKKKGGIALGALILALLAAVAGGVYYFLFGTDSPAAAKKTKKNTAPTTTKPNVQRTQPPTKGSTRVTTVTTSKTAADHGPLSEEPAERDEELLTSIDEQLSTLDTLDDDQRGGPDPR